MLLSCSMCVFSVEGYCPIMQEHVGMTQGNLTVKVAYRREA